MLEQNQGEVFEVVMWIAEVTMVIDLMVVHMYLGKQIHRIILNLIIFFTDSVLKDQKLEN